MIRKTIMDITNPVIQLCMAGTRAEFEHRLEDARRLYQQAWEARTDDYGACIAAHYFARFQDSAEESLRWNQIALDHANAVPDERVKDFYPSLYLSLGRSYELAGNQVEAQRYYDLAAALGVVHQPDCTRGLLQQIPDGLMANRQISAEFHYCYAIKQIEICSRKLFFTNP